VCDLEISKRGGLGPFCFVAPQKVKVKNLTSQSTQNAKHKVLKTAVRHITKSLLYKTPMYKTGNGFGF
jgi:hypothetical protein